MVELALTMKVKLTTNKHESEALNRLCDNYTSCCNEVSDWIGEHHTLSQRKINEAVYHPLRDKYGLLAQMTQSSIRRVIASYKAIHSRMERRNGENLKRKRTAYYSTRPKYSSAGVDLLWNRDYSYSSMTGMFGLPVMDGRIKVKAQWKGIPDEYRTARFRYRPTDIETRQMVPAYSRHPTGSRPNPKPQKHSGRGLGNPNARHQL